MRQVRLILIAVAALAVPALLALGVHFAAGGSLTAPPPVVARVSTAPIAAPSTVTTATTTSRSDRCAEPEHRNDTRCRMSDGAPADDHSGRGSGSGNSGSGNSGSGKSGSGRSGDDD